MIRKTVAVRAGAIIATGLILTGATGAQATLIGDEITCSTNQVDPQCNSAMATVSDPGHEFDIGTIARVNVGASSVRITSLSSGLQSVDLTLGDLDWVGMNGQITGIDNFLSAVAGITAAAVTANPHSIIFDFGNGGSVNWTRFQSVSFDLVTEHIPEPGALALLGFGLAGLGFVRRRKAA